MKKIALLTLLVLTNLNIFAQSETNELQKLKLKKGIYLSFQQITADNPSHIDSFTVKERTNGDIVMWGGGKYTFELAPENKVSFKKIRKEFVGISDGENFYISDRFTIKGWQGMTSCILSGPYIIAPIQSSAGQFTGGGLIPSMIKVGNGYLINIKEGSSIPLSKKVLKELLKKYPTLMSEYADQNLMDSAVDIIDKINQMERKE